MKFNYFLLSFCFLFMNQVLACEVKDDLGNTVDLVRPAQRIISLAPDLTEILFAIGAGQQVVGVDRGSDYPAATAKIVKVASYNGFDAERLMSLHPDLIVAWAETDYVSALKKLGVPVYLSRQRKLSDLVQTMRRLGCLAGVEKQADQVSNRYLQRYQQLQARFANRHSYKVFYQVWPKPLMTITKRSWINEVITLCGGKNIFADLSGVAPEVSIESVIALDPDVILGVKSKYSWTQQWQEWPNLKAVKNHRVYAIDADSIERAGPRILDGVEQVCVLMQ